MKSYKIYSTGEYSYKVFPNGDIYSLDHSVEFTDGHTQFYKGKKIRHFYQTLKDGSRGYTQVSIQYDKCVRRAIGLHRILAECFIPNPNNYPCVNHKDGNKNNNDLTNLEWCTYSYNNAHAYTVGLNKARCKKVYCKELDMEFPSTKAAAEYIGGNRRGVAAVCNRGGTHKKLHWMYI